MGRLIAVSNRVSPPRELGESSAGGLAMALQAALKASDGMWFGWSGATIPEFTGKLSIERVHDVTIATVDLDHQDYEEYYAGYANATIWPLFHYRIDLTEYDRSFGEGYDRVNERFAETLTHLIAADDIIWVHDYHLIPLARELRRRGVANRIGFFLHIPWPSRQLLTTLPHHRELVRAIFDYDLVGFHTEDWLQAFTRYVISEADGAVTADGASAFGKSVRLGVFPIGIDAREFGDAARSDAARGTFERMRASLAGRKMILGVDRLDYSKGLEERFNGYEQYLLDNEEHRQKVFLLQIAMLSREGVDAYRDLRTRLDAATGRINGAFSTFDWVPVRYVNTGYRRDELAGIYRAANAALVTPLRDGMNLVAKEFVAAQDPEDPGVLILSRFAGAASQMREALIVNPFSREEIAEAIRLALDMPRPERIARWRALKAGVDKDDVYAWSDSFIAALSA
ncbi:MAG: alpha,alpha-trehalose-phosphate synthase (UDP-forming) [Alphaproteobacteria bacterium]|nr:alpha,alpha-trehalose-phosphate synthase (UDP-forming) [Alphaproteobacteria bacterium]